MNRVYALLLAVVFCGPALVPAMAASGMPGEEAACLPDDARPEARCSSGMPFFARIQAGTIQSCKTCWSGRDNCVSGCDKLTSLGEQEHCKAACNRDWRCTEGFDCR
jgi:hypothetical protein